MVRDLQQARHAPKRGVRLLEAGGVDHEPVTNPQRVEQLLLAERRRAEPPEVGRHPARQQRIDKLRQVLGRVAVDVEGDDLALPATRDLGLADLGRDPCVEVPPPDRRLFADHDRLRRMLRADAQGGAPRQLFVRLARRHADQGHDAGARMKVLVVSGLIARELVADLA